MSVHIFVLATPPSSLPARMMNPLSTFSIKNLTEVFSATAVGIDWKNGLI
jgi:hypothetical protein